MDKYRFKNFVMNNKYILILLLFLPIAAIIGFSIVQCCNSEILDWGSFLGGFLAYVGTAILGILAAFLTIRSEKNNEIFKIKELKTLELQFANDELKKNNEIVKNAMKIIDFNIFNSFIEKTFNLEIEKYLEYIKESLNSFYKIQVELEFINGFCQDSTKCYDCERICSYKEQSEKYKTKLSDFAKAFYSYSDNFHKCYSLIGNVILKKINSNQMEKYNNSIIQQAKIKLEDLKNEAVINENLFIYNSPKGNVAEHMEDFFNKSEKLKTINLYIKEADEVAKKIYSDGDLFKDVDSLYETIMKLKNDNSTLLDKAYIFISQSERDIFTNIKEITKIS